MIVDIKEPLQGTRLFACVVTKLYVGSQEGRFLRWICWPIGISDKLPTTNILLGLNLPKAEGLESNQDTGSKDILIENASQVAFTQM